MKAGAGRPEIHPLKFGDGTPRSTRKPAEDVGVEHCPRWIAQVLIVPSVSAPIMDRDIVPSHSKAFSWLDHRAEERVLQVVRNVASVLVALS